MTVPGFGRFRSAQDHRRRSGKSILPLSRIVAPATIADLQLTNSEQPHRPHEEHVIFYSPVEGVETGSAPSPLDALKIVAIEHNKITDEIGGKPLS